MFIKDEIRSYREEYQVPKPEILEQTKCSVPGCPQSIMAPKGTPQEELHCAEPCWYKIQLQVKRYQKEKERLGIRE